MTSVENVVWSLMGVSIVSGVSLGVMYRRMLTWRWRIHLAAFANIGVLIGLGGMHGGVSKDRASWFMNHAAHEWVWIPIGLGVFVIALMVTPRKPGESDKRS